MTLFRCEERCSCISLAVVASLIIGIITAFLQITGTITVAIPFLWVAFGIAVAYLAITLLAVSLSRGTAVGDCIYPALAAVLIGILGTILLALVLLAFGIVATNVISAILVGALLFSFSLLFTATACLVKCLAFSRE